MLNFLDFVEQCQRRPEQTTECAQDPVLAKHGPFNINRREDSATQGLLKAVEKRPAWDSITCIVLSAVLRFSATSAAKRIAFCIDKADEGSEGTGKSGLTLNLPIKKKLDSLGASHLSRTQWMELAQVSECMASLLVSHVESAGPFKSVTEASDFIASLMTLESGQNPFSAASETAKDLVYFKKDTLIDPATAYSSCRLRKSAENGLKALQGEGLEMPRNLRELKTYLHEHNPDLHGWMTEVDVDRALHEYHKYRCSSEQHGCVGGSEGMSLVNMHLWYSNVLWFTLTKDVLQHTCSCCRWWCWLAPL